MKVIQINNRYIVGSTGKLVSSLHHYLLDNGVCSIVYYGRERQTPETGVLKTSSDLYSKLNHLYAILTGNMYGHCFLSTRKIIKLIKKEQPDIVHLQCINCYFVNIYKLVGWLKKNNIKTVVTLHAEFMFTGSCPHLSSCEKWRTGCGKCPNLKDATGSLFFDRTAASWKKMYRAFEGFNDNLIVTSVSPWLMEKAKQSPILKGKYHCVVQNGVDCNVFHYRDSSALRERYNINAKHVVFHATPRFSFESNDIKGGHYVLEFAKRVQSRGIAVIVAGPSYGVDVDKLPDNLILLGSITNQEELASLYSLADATLLTSKKETFSMVTAESLCCGTPVVGFNAGAPEQITIPEYSSFCEYGDVDALLDGVLYFIERKINKAKIAEDAKAKYDKVLMCENYYNIYSKLCLESAK